MKHILTALFLLFVSVSSISAQSTKIVWNTKQASLTADKMAITVNGETYYSNNTAVVQSDPGDANYTTLESIWKEDGKEMRLFIYFSTDGTTWKVTEMRTYDGTVPGNWVYYDGFNGGFAGNAYSSPSTFTSQDGKGKITFTNLKLNAFLPSKPQTTTTGYYLEPTVGDNTVLVTTEPGTGYGVNVLLKDSSGKVVSNQQSISYEWNIQNPELAAISTFPICAYGIVEPCPVIHVSISGIRAGQTKVNVFANKNGVELAATSIPVVVTADTSVSANYGNEVTNDQLAEISSQLAQTQQEIEDIKQEQSVIRQMIDEIWRFIRNIFGRE